MAQKVQASGRWWVIMRGMDDIPYKQKDLLSAEDVARYFGVGQMTVYRWCKEGRLQCIKLSKQWRIRREALEDFLSQHERSTTLVGRLSSFLRVPDNVLAIAQNIDILHRLDAAFFGVGDARGGLLVKYSEVLVRGRPVFLADWDDGPASSRAGACGDAPYGQEADPLSNL